MQLEHSGNGERARLENLGVELDDAQKQDSSSFSNVQASSSKDDFLCLPRIVCLIKEHVELL